MADNEKVSIWGGVPRFGTTPTTGQAIAGGGTGFVIYDSAEDNTGVIPAASIPMPNKNMELAQKTIAGVTTKYYGFAGYCGSFYSQVTQSNLAAENIVEFDTASVLYLTDILGTPITQLTALHPGVYRISGTLDFYANEAKVPVNPVTQWSDIALELFVNVWIKKNGTLVPWTYRDYKLIGDYPRLIVNIDYMVYLDTNDYIQIAWNGTDALSVLDPNITLVNAYADAPSALINMTLVR